MVSTGSTTRAKDLIYLYTLHWEEGVTIDVDVRKRKLYVVHVNQKQPPTLPNPIDAVSRQLRAETHGVISEANDVDLRSHNFRYPSQYDLKQFTKHIGVAATARLRRLSISGTTKLDPLVKLSYDETYGHAQRFVEFCVSEPKTVVVRRFDRVVDNNNETWLSHSLAMKDIIRGPQVLPSGLIDSALLLDPYVSRQLGSPATQFRSLPPNLRFTVVAAFPEAK